MRKDSVRCLMCLSSCVRVCSVFGWPKVSGVSIYLCKGVYGWPKVSDVSIYLCKGV